MLTHIGQGDVLVCLNCGKPIVLTNKTFTLDCYAEYIECPNCKAKYDVQVYHARGSKILGKEAEFIIDEANAYRGEKMTREEAISVLQDKSHFDTSVYGYEAIDVAIEALQAEPKHGEWKVIIKTEDEMQARCSECKMVYFLGMGRNPNYCPNCGAKMDKD